MIRKKDGTTTSDSTVETMMPPITAIAIGARNEPPSPTPSADGSMPADMAIEVMMIGRARLRPASTMASTRAMPRRRHLDREIDEQDGVLGDDAHQHQDADQDRHRQRIVGDDQRDRHAADRKRQREQDGERLDHILEEQDQHGQHQHQAHQHRVAEALLHFVLDLGVAAFDKLHASAGSWCP